VATRELRTREPVRETATLLAALRAQDPAVIRPLWERYSALVFRVLRYSLRSAQVSVEAAAQEVFLQVFRWGPRLQPGSELKMFVVRAITRTVERLSKPPRIMWGLREHSRTVRARSRFASDYPPGGSLKPRSPRAGP
jgi:hypothetical protein